MLEDLSQISSMKLQLAEVQRKRAQARQELDKDRACPIKRRTFFALDREYARLISQLSA